MYNNKIEIDLNLNVNPHLQLDFELKYKKFIQPLREVFEGYILQQHFLDYFSSLQHPRMLRETLKEMKDLNLIETIEIGKYNFLYLKRNALILLTKDNSVGALRVPSHQRIVRSLIFAEALDNFISTNVKKLDTYVQEIDFDKEENRYTILLIDNCKSLDKYINFIESLTQAETYNTSSESFYDIKFCSFSKDRAILAKEYFSKNSKLYSYKRQEVVNNGKDNKHYFNFNIKVFNTDVDKKYFPQGIELSNQ